MPIVSTISAQPDHASAMTLLREVADALPSRFAQAAALLHAAEDIPAYRHVPLEHQRQLHSTNQLERDDEWAVAERRCSSPESMKLTTTPTLSTTTWDTTPSGFPLRLHVRSPEHSGGRGTS